MCLLRISGCLLAGHTRSEYLSRVPNTRLPTLNLRFLIADEDDARHLRSLLRAFPGKRPMRSLFPNLVLWVQKSRLIMARQDDRLVLGHRQWHECNLEIFGPVTARMFSHILKDLPIRWETPVRTLMEVQSIDLVESITFHKGAKIFQDSEVLPQNAYYRQERRGACLEVILDPTMPSDEDTKQSLRIVLDSLKPPEGSQVLPNTEEYWSPSWTVKFSRCNMDIYGVLIDMVCIPDSLSIDSANLVSSPAWRIHYEFIRPASIRPYHFRLGPTDILFT